MAGKKHSPLGWILTSLLGTALHFLYEWSGEAVWAASLSGVNESVWEHMKLLAVPVLFWSAVQGRGRVSSNFWAVRAASLLAGLLLIPVVYYTYTGALGFRVTAVDIALFYVAAALVFFLDHRLGKEGRLSASRQQTLGCLALVILGLLFVLFTFYPPRFPLWQDPMTGRYGVRG